MLRLCTNHLRKEVLIYSLAELIKECLKLGFNSTAIWLAQMHPSLCISLIETLLCFIDEKCVFELDILWFVYDFDPFIIFKMQHIFLITAKDIKSNLLFYSGWKSLKFDFLHSLKPWIGLFFFLPWPFTHIHYWFF